MKLIWSVESWNDYFFWQETGKRMVKKINELIQDIRRPPFEGKGKPEPLKYNLAGFWSRRITGEHRLVYSITNDALLWWRLAAITLDNAVVGYPFLARSVATACTHCSTTLSTSWLMSMRMTSSSCRSGRSSAAN